MEGLVYGGSSIVVVVINKRAANIIHVRRVALVWTDIVYVFVYASCVHFFLKKMRLVWL